MTAGNRDGRAVNISLYDLSVWVLPLLLAITFHEAAHAFVAYRLVTAPHGSSAVSASTRSATSTRSAR
jgi:hypothetical protein